MVSENTADSCRALTHAEIQNAFFGKKNAFWHATQQRSPAEIALKKNPQNQDGVA
jgi:hypothetical protein